MVTIILLVFVRAIKGPEDRILLRMPSRAPAAASETTYDIQYSDGDQERRVPRSRIKLRRNATSGNTDDRESDSDDADDSESSSTGQEGSGELTVGTNVRVNWKGRGVYYSGTIASINHPVDDDDDDDGGDSDDNNNNNNNTHTKMAKTPKTTTLISLLNPAAAAAAAAATRVYVLTVFAQWA